MRPRIGWTDVKQEGRQQTVAGKRDTSAYSVPQRAVFPMRINTSA